MDEEHDLTFPEPEEQEVFEGDSVKFWGRTVKLVYAAKSIERHGTTISTGMGKTSWKYSVPTGVPLRKSRAGNIWRAGERRIYSHLVPKICE